MAVYLELVADDVAVFAALGALGRQAAVVELTGDGDLYLSVDLRPGAAPVSFPDPAWTSLGAQPRDRDSDGLVDDGGPPPACSRGELVDAELASVDQALVALAAFGDRHGEAAELSEQLRVRRRQLMALPYADPGSPPPLPPDWDR